MLPAFPENRSLTTAKLVLPSPTPHYSGASYSFVYGLMQTIYLQ